MLGQKHLVMKLRMTGQPSEQLVSHAFLLCDLYDLVPAVALMQAGHCDCSVPQALGRASCMTVHVWQSAGSTFAAVCKASAADAADTWCSSASHVSNQQ